jgi:hypothetical protein
VIRVVRKGGLNVIILNHEGWVRRTDGMITRNLRNISACAFKAE